jgi:hypothetical protein
MLTQRNGAVSVLFMLLMLVAGGTLSAQTYPLQQQSPTGFNINSTVTNAIRGYRFQCNANGITVVSLGCYYPVHTASPYTVTISLWNFNTQQLLGQVSTTTQGSWVFMNLTNPVPLTNGQQYIVCGHHGSGGYYYQSFTAPSPWLPTGDIQYMDMRFTSSTNPSTFPTSVLTNYQYGVVDIGYSQGLTVTTPSPLPQGSEQQGYSTTIQADFGQLPYNWNTSFTGLPPNLTASQVGDDLVISGTPTAGSAGTYNFTVTVTDANSDVATKPFSLYILPPAIPAPYADDFSTNQGWQLGTGWQIGSATPFNSSTSGHEEPAFDNSPTSDNMILGHMIGADYTNNMSGRLRHLAAH